MRKKLGILSANTAVPLVYATWNPEKKGNAVTLSVDNLTLSQSGDGCAYATISVSSGKWYWEVFNSAVPPSICSAGIALPGAKVFLYTGGDVRSYGYLSDPNNAIYNANIMLIPNHMGSYATGDTLMFALDMDNGAWYIGVNGVWQHNKANVQGVPTSGAAVTGAILGPTTLLGNQFYPMAGYKSGTLLTANFGASAFTYPVPARYNAGVYQ